MLINGKAQAAVTKLDISQFINEYKSYIFERLRECYKKALAVKETDRKEGIELIFMAEALPLISGIINIGSNLQNFQEAKQWAKEIVPNANPVSVLSALIFIYIIDEKTTKLVNGKNKKELEIWSNIRKWVKALIE